MKYLIPGILIALLVCGTGCQSFMHGYTSVAAQNKYMLVESNPETFGFKRLSYIRGYRRVIDNFIKEAGTPEMIAEYKDEKGRDSLAIYYMKKDMVYFFSEVGFGPESFALKGARPISDSEKETFIGIIQNKN